MRPFSVLAPNKSSGDRVKDLKAKHIFKDAKLSFKKNVNRCNNFNNTIRFTKQGGLKSTESNELRQLLARGYSLCEDGICDSNSVVCDISSTSIKKRGLLNCSHSNMASAVKIDTNTNLFSHFVQQLLPSQGDKPIPMIASYDPSYCAIDISYGIIIDPKCSTTHSDGAGIIFDPSGLYVDSCATGGGGAISGIEKQKHLWNSTAILGSNDISGQYQVCQGGGGVNLSWGNNTKQNYLVSYNPTNKIRFGINPQAKKIVACDVTTATAIAAAAAAAAAAIAIAKASTAASTASIDCGVAGATATAAVNDVAIAGASATASATAATADATTANSFASVASTTADNALAYADAVGTAAAAADAADAAAVAAVIVAHANAAGVAAEDACVAEIAAAAAVAAAAVAAGEVTAACAAAAAAAAAVATAVAAGDTAAACAAAGAAITAAAAAGAAAAAAVAAVAAGDAAATAATTAAAVAAVAAVSAQDCWLLTLC